MPRSGGGKTDGAVASIQAGAARTIGRYQTVMLSA
jgi:hypothetical protein